MQKAPFLDSLEILGWPCVVRGENRDDRGGEETIFAMLSRSSEEVKTIPPPTSSSSCSCAVAHIQIDSGDMASMK